MYCPIPAARTCRKAPILDGDIFSHVVVVLLVARLERLVSLRDDLFSRALIHGSQGDESAAVACGWFMSSVRMIEMIKIMIVWTHLFLTIKKGKSSE